MGDIKNEKINVLSFDWEEVNASVFKNTQIYKLKKNNKNLNKIAVIVPDNFSYIYKDADIVFSISQNTLSKFGIESYRNVLEYISVSKNIFDSRVNRLVSFLIQMTNNSFLNKLIGKLYTSTRQKKFYIKSGLEKISIKKIKEVYKNIKYTRSGDFYDICSNKYFTNDLEKHFIRQFNYLYEMIMDGSLYDSEFDVNILKEYPELEIFHTHQGKKIILRTRNFKNKATTHNSKPKLLLNLIVELLKRDETLLVVNLGLPILELDINNSRYIEIDHNMSFKDELSLCQEADFCIMTAEAGLFTAYAASNINIIQYDDEWFPANSPENKLPTQLFEARKNIKMNDLDLRDDLKNEKYADASNEIIANYSKINHISSNNQIVKFEL